MDRAEWLYLYGKCLYLLSFDSFSLPINQQWQLINFLPHPVVEEKDYSILNLGNEEQAQTGELLFDFLRQT